MRTSFSIKKFFVSLTLLMIACFGFIFAFAIPFESIDQGVVTYFLPLMLKLVVFGIIVLAQLYLTYYLLVLLWCLIRNFISFLYSVLRIFAQKLSKHK